MAELKERRYLRAREVAERLGVGVTTIYRLIQQGQFIEGAKFGGSRRWDVQEVDRWAAEQADQTQHEQEREEFTRQLLNCERSN